MAAWKDMLGWLAPPGTRRRRWAKRLADALLARVYALQARRISEGSCLTHTRGERRGVSPPVQAPHRRADAAPLARRPHRRADAAPLASVVLHLYDQTTALRQAFPLGLTPAGRLRLLACLLRQSGALAIEPDDAAEFLAAMAASPSHGLAETYRRQPAWQRAVPHGLTRDGWDQLKRWVRATYRLGDEAAWLEEAACPDSAAGPPAPGVNVLAHFRYPSGLQVAALHTVEALRRQGLDVCCRDVPSSARADLPGRDGYLGLHPHRITISHLAPAPLAEDCYPLCGLARRSETFRIGYWYWELDDAPRRWARHASWVHEVWAPTRFIAEAMRRVVPMPVFDMLPGIAMPPTTETSRRELGLPEDRYLFLFVFDMGSTAARKNPLAAIAAFGRAFPHGDDAALVIKVSRGWADAAALAELRAAADGRRIILLDEVAPRERVFALMAACDAYVSLHRSEGFGLTMAEAMALGKPVVATRYSGNLDFMTDDNSLLVDYRLVPLARAAGLYRRGRWAEPSVEHAAALMRRLADDPARGRLIGERARRDVQERLSLEAAGARMARRLAELGEGTGGPARRRIA